ncbi:Hypothetical protein PBC10988_40240 [Planctomycetales bacterium 10988]|nr:Hypothetical protein PBC10988_40240 [Planctomycetales bacterium 10988]
MKPEGGTLKIPPPASTPDSSSVPPNEIEQQENKNLWLLASYMISLRVGWIFKAETVIMPAVINSINDSPWVRAFMPVLSRLGQSMPPLFYAPWLRGLPRKKRALMLTSTLMSLPFLILCLTWYYKGTQNFPGLAVLFLLLYFLFFCSTGLNMLTAGTLQGKLIRPNRRGRLMMLSGLLGTVAACTAAWLLLQRWLKEGASGFIPIFAMSAVCFLTAAFVTSRLAEPADPPRSDPPKRRLHALLHIVETIRNHAPFRKLILVAMFFITSLSLTPHYQTLGSQGLFPDSTVNRVDASNEPGGTDKTIEKKKLSTSQTAFSYTLWVITQNIGAGLMGAMAGWLADRWGTRLALRFQLALAMFTPLVALLFAQFPEETRSLYFGFLYFLLGSVPITIKILSNYVLELVPNEDHPHYLSTLQFSLVIPLFLSPVIGVCISLFGYPSILLLISAVVATGFGLTFTMLEPRHHPELRHPSEVPNAETPI